MLSLYHVTRYGNVLLVDKYLCVKTAKNNRYPPIRMFFCVYVDAYCCMVFIFMHIDVCCCLLYAYQCVVCM